MTGLKTTLDFFILSDSNTIAISLSILLNKKAINTFSFHMAKELFAHLHLGPTVIFIIEELSTISHKEILQIIQTHSPSSRVIFIGCPIVLEESIELIRLGAFDYWTLETPIEKKLSQFLTTYIYSEIQSESEDSLIEKFKLLGFIGSHKSMCKVYKFIERAAQANIPIVITGELGTGKELTAKTIHALSNRKQGSLQYVNLSSIPVELMETLLFGKEKAVFTGNLKRKIGAIEMASGGTLVISHITLLPLFLQQKLFNALKEGKFLRPEGSNIVFFNARIIICTEVTLKKFVNKGSFSAELYHLINRLSIKIPPLRNRKQDILALANYFLRNFIQQNKLKTITFTTTVKDVLLAYPYLGNIYELRAIVEASALMTTNTEIAKEQLIIQPKDSTKNWLEEELTLEDFSKKIIYHYLERYDNNVIVVAKKLAIGKSTIYRLLQKKRSLK